jgi:hypothetical protein
MPVDTVPDTSQRSPAAPSPASPRGLRHAPAADAARQVLLRRLASPLKHDMVVNLQAVSMLTETLAARLERNALLATDLAPSVAKLNRLARDAVAACLKVASWMDAADDPGTPLATAVDDCLQLLSANFNFRGLRLSAQVPPVEFEVSRAGTRAVLAATLLMLADAAPGPGELLVEADVSGDEAVLTVVYFEGDPGDAWLPQDTAVQKIEWAHVQALAAAESMSAAASPREVVLRVPRPRVTTPLQMAPI